MIPEGLVWKEEMKEEESKNCFFEYSGHELD